MTITAMVHAGCFRQRHGMQGIPIRLEHNVAGVRFKAEVFLPVKDFASGEMTVELISKRVIQECERLFGNSVSINVQVVSVHYSNN